MTNQVRSGEVFYLVEVTGLETCLDKPPLTGLREVLDFLVFPGPPKIMKEISAGDTQQSFRSASGTFDQSGVYQVLTAVFDLKREEAASMGKRKRPSEYDYDDKVTADIYIGTADKFTTDAAGKLHPLNATHIADAYINAASIRKALGRYDTPEARSAAHAATTVTASVKAMKPLKLKTGPVQ